MKGTNSPTPHCIALEGEPGGGALCSIYERRPSVCREFQASYANGEPNEACDRARASRGLPPLTPDDWRIPDGDLPRAA